MSLSRQLLAALAAAFAFAAAPASALTVVEYYHQGLDHYFITSIAGEIEVLDSGRMAGWARTGQSFETFPPGDARLANASPVCRFYGNPAAGLNSHFYSASPAECAAVLANWPDAWQLETNDLFRVHQVTTAGACPVGTKAVYRLWNRRADVNHRYTTDLSIVEAMLAKGYILEGSGGGQRPIAFCAADLGTTPPAAGTPACTITASTTTPVLGNAVTLTAACTNAPTAFAWTNCTGTSSTCTASASAPGAVNYTVAGSNAAGSGAPASLTLNWQTGGGTPGATGTPACTVAASSPTPTFGTALTLTATCSNTPQQFDWLGCSALLNDLCSPLSECSTTSSTCRPVASQIGPVYYALIARNAVGPGTKAGVPVEWVSGGTTPPPPPATPVSVCTIQPSSSAPAVNSTLTLTASCTNSPTAYNWSGCTSTGPTCTTTETSAVTRTYSVIARNAAGIGPSTQVTIAWQQPPTAPPVCTIAASTQAPYVGGTLTLTANCTQSPTSYQWTNCASTGPTCQATSAQTGSATYAVAGVNQFGAGQAASTTVAWGTPPPAGADFCGNYPSTLRVTLPWAGSIDTPNEGGLRADAVFVGRLVVPPAATGRSSGAVRAVEFMGEPANRIMTLSRSACDFRGFTPGQPLVTDPTGASNPIAWSSDQTPRIAFSLVGNGGSVQLTPGETYYVNIRTVSFTTGQGSCSVATCDMRVSVSPPF